MGLTQVKVQDITIGTFLWRAMAILPNMVSYGNFSQITLANSQIMGLVSRDVFRRTECFDKLWLQDGKYWVP